MIYGLTFLLIGVAVANYARYRDALYPAFLHAVLWAFLSLVLASYESEFWQLRPLTVVTFGAGVLCFTLGCHMSTYGFRPAVGKRKEVVGIPSRRVTWAILAAAVLILPFFVQRVMAINASGPTDSFYINVRWMISFGGATLGPAAYGATVSFTAVFLCLLVVLREDRTWRDFAAFGVATGVALAFALLQTGRTAMFMLVFVLFVPPVALRYVRPGRAALVLLSIMVLLFGLLGVVVRGETGLGSLGDTLSAAATSFRHYFIGGAYAFDGLVAHRSPVELGANTGRFFFALAQTLGFHVDVKPLVQEFSYPFDTNVYTFYQPYFLDFDLPIAVGMQFVVGVFHGALYRSVARRQVRAWHLFVFAIAVYPLFMQFFQDQYLNLLSTWIQLALLGWFAFGMPRFVRGLIRARARPTLPLLAR